ncbi:unnamed protein product (mitochondrion) [Plasmodiophora brassicae]|uniref:N-acetyltransferase domain-containing protein n=1 Tax=Plasmodiophora brassicae TaxID=37360 RepID=A0A0G4IW75_PLABS|nr:hypothetical protein PBRA_007326 [Plasmodiophora brassicae]SPQ95910.1 unnamed protein product [Plasmodiophora brassicae]
MAYVIDAAKSVDLSGVVPRTATLRDGTQVTIDRLNRAAREDITTLRDLLNGEIESGTYPQDRPVDDAGFLAYYASHEVFVARSTQSGTILGSFYVKPNFPGRCAHICNSGFLVVPAYRGRGVGRALAEAFEAVAPACGYRAAFFNLVFEDNPASLALWDSLHYVRTGRVPGAKVPPSGTPVDAVMFYKAFGSCLGQ